MGRKTDKERYNLNERYALMFNGTAETLATLKKITNEGVEPLDEIIHIKTGFENPKIKEYIKLGREIAKKENIKYTTLYSDIDPAKNFYYYLLLYEYKNKKGEQKKGYGLPTRKRKWCKTILYRRPLNKYIKEQKKEGNQLRIYECITDKSRDKGGLYPLLQWKMNHKNCLEYLALNNINYGNLYYIYEKIPSCFLCPFMRMQYYRNLYKTQPELFEILQKIQNKIEEPYLRNPDYTINQLYEKFDNENKNIFWRDLPKTNTHKV